MCEESLVDRDTPVSQSSSSRGKKESECVLCVLIATLVTVSLHHLLHWLMLLVLLPRDREEEERTCLVRVFVCDTHRHRHRHHYVQVTSGRSSKNSRRAEETVPSDERSLTEESHLIPAGFAGCSPAKIR